MTGAPSHLVRDDQPGPEMRAVLSARRWSCIALTVVSVFGFILSLPIGLGEIPIAPRVIVVAALVCTVTGTILSRRTLGLWLLVAATGLLFVVVFFGNESWTRFDPLVAVFLCVLFAITLVPRTLGFVITALGVAVIIWANADAIPVLTVGNLVITSVWVRALQILAAGLALTIAWDRILDSAREGDAQRAGNERDLAESLRVQERLRVWRDTAIRVHETVLNDIRYVLSATQIDRERLARELGNRPRAGRLQASPGLSLPEIVHGAVFDSGIPGAVDIEVPAVRIDATMAPYLRSALIEVLRNASRHTVATTITIRAESDSRWTSVICDLGTERLGDDAAPGIGRSIVLGEAIRTAGGEFLVDGTCAVIRVPEPASLVRSDGVSLTSSPGRLVIAAGFAAIALGAFPYPLALLLTPIPALWVAGAFTLILLAAGFYISLRSRLVPVWIGGSLSVIATAVPMVMLIPQGACFESSSLAVVINIGGYSLLAGAVWARGRWGGLLVVPWVAASIAFLVAQPSIACGGVPINAISAAVVVALVLAAVVEASLRRSVRLDVEARRAAEARVQQAAQSEAAVDVARDLDEAVTAAWDVMTDIAEGADLDRTRRAILRGMEARIRGTIQVDPRTSGAFALLALFLIMRAVASGHAVRVLSLRDSQDRTELPTSVRDLLDAVVCASDNHEPTIQTFTYGKEDHLTITVSTDAVLRAGMHVGASWTDADTEVEIQGDSSPGGVVSVLVRRPAQ